MSDLRISLETTIILERFREDVSGASIIEFDMARYIQKLEAAQKWIDFDPGDESTWPKVDGDYVAIAVPPHESHASPSVQDWGNDRLSFWKAFVKAYLPTPIPDYGEDG